MKENDKNCKKKKMSEIFCSRLKLGGRSVKENDDYMRVHSSRKAPAD